MTGKTSKPLQIRCDVSKPLEVSIGKFTGDKNDPGIIRARELGRDDPLGWKMSAPISFVDSRNHAAIQLADIIAGAAVWCLGRDVPEGFEDTIKIIERHVLQDTIMPDYEMVDLTQRVPAVNYFILYDLAERAESGTDPYDGLAETYRAAEVSWAKGEFPQAKKSA